MGTMWHVRFARPPHANLTAIGAAIVARLGNIVAEMSQWEAASYLSRFNRAPAGSWFALPPDFAHVVAAGLRIAAATDGAFDPAIGRLTDLWGFGPVSRSTPPDEATLRAARAASGWRRLEFDPGARRLRQPGGLALDLSGIAKGHAVDAIADLLAAKGLGHCLVEIGGELAGRGVRPDGQPWWVDVEQPPGSTLPPLRIALHGLAVATSGDYRRGAHTLDPRTGRSTANGVVSVTVIHASAMDADAWATAVTVLGGDAGIAAAEVAGIAACVVVMIDGEARELLSPAFAAMLAD
ncbi:FAD:protein FMN transferase [Sphingomonas nostoxanthinifaciens]|uniref:FAD:protein FMN transferase n=1 Tax=Sphingomonas nostoxanthinifaciens TaxID=2872652 RepID=UPI001CC1F33A|nr:FAD:protein FMN transferase [Sphingomonas nostoxanthinifaciens]